MIVASHPFLDVAIYHPLLDDSSHPFLDVINYHPILDDSSHLILDDSSHPILDDSSHPFFEPLDLASKFRYNFDKNGIMNA